MEFVLLGSEVGGISGMDARLRFDLQKRGKWEWLMVITNDFTHQNGAFTKGVSG